MDSAFNHEDLYKIYRIMNVRRKIPPARPNEYKAIQNQIFHLSHLHLQHQPTALNAIFYIRPLNDSS